MLKDARLQLRQKQAECAERAGISQSQWSVLELGRQPATIPTLNRAAHAVGGSLDAWIRQASAADRPRDAVQLRVQELIIATAVPGAWGGLPEEQIDREARTSRFADVLLHRRRRRLPADEYAIIEVIDWFADVGDPLRDWTRRLDALERYAISRMAGDDPLPRTSGCWVIRATQRNRRLVGEHRHVFRARFPGSGRAWLAALTDPATPMPGQPALLWVSVDGQRLFPARLG